MIPMSFTGVENDTVCALSSVSGTAAIAVIRLSGPDAIVTIDTFFSPFGKKKKLHEATSYTAHHGTLTYGDEILDEVVVNIYLSPRSYTGENMAEIFCHGSPYIQTRILEVLIALGCRMARPGEFTLRSFLNGKLDLSQAEAVADLIASQSKAAHDLSIKQLKGGFSKKIEDLRRQLLHFTSLIELELDFSEEDVEFADRTKLTTLIEAIRQEITILLDSFKLGNVLKKGIPVAIIGKPNVGKSTLLNILLNEDRAIVSPTPGTTRDAIEDTITLDGITFRFIDTAGLRHATDDIEHMGIEKTIEKIKQAYIILYLFDIGQTSVAELNENLRELEEIAGNDDKKIVLIGNKSDMLVEIPATFKTLVEKETIFISAKRRENIQLITDKLTETVKATHFSAGDTVVSNARHYEALTHANSIISDIIPLIQSGTSHELLAADLRRALLYLGEITGVQITNENILDEIFGNFCIGK